MQQSGSAPQRETPSPESVVKNQPIDPGSGLLSGREFAAEQIQKHLEREVESISTATKGGMLDQSIAAFDLSRQYTVKQALEQLEKEANQNIAATTGFDLSGQSTVEQALKQLERQSELFVNALKGGALGHVGSPESYGFRSQASLDQMQEQMKRVFGSLAVVLGESGVAKTFEQAAADGQVLGQDAKNTGIPWQKKRDHPKKTSTSKNKEGLLNEQIEYAGHLGALTTEVTKLSAMIDTTIPVWRDDIAKREEDSRRSLECSRSALAVVRWTLVVAVATLAVSAMAIWR